MKHSSSRLRWLPNAITSIRLVAIVPLVVCSVLGLWEWALGIYVIALVSDFFDGLAARKLGVSSAFGEQLDGMSDTALGGAVALGLLIGGAVPVAVFVAAFFGWLSIYLPRHFPKQLPTINALQPMFDVGTLFMTITYSMWTLVTLVYGWSNWYIPATLGILLVLAVLKRRRLRLWCAAILPEKWQLPKEA